MKRFLALLTSVVMVLALLAGCGNGNSNTDKTPDTPDSNTPEDVSQPEAENPSAPEKSSDPLEMITDGYYSYSYPVDGIGDFTYYLHFYNEAPVLGSVFYAGYCLNQINYAGTYTVEETPCEYSCYAQRGDAEMVSGTAPYTVTFYDWDGNMLDACGFDGEILYNDMETVSANGAGPSYYTHDTEGENSKYYEVYQGEAPQKFLDFVADDPTSTLTLYHNGFYMDLMNMLIEGSWAIESSDESGISINLVPNSSSDTPAKLTVSADKKSAVYTPDGGEAINVINTSETGPKAAGEMRGQFAIPGQEDLFADIILTMYDDSSCDVNLDAFGNVIPLDTGSYVLGEDGFTFTFTFDMAGEVSSVLDETSFLPTIQYVQAGTDLGDIDVLLTSVLPE